MRRVALILATVGILCIAAGQAQAKGHHGHHGHHGHQSHYSHHGWHGAVVRPPVIVARPFYPPVYRYGYYGPWSSSSFYYQGPRVSVGVGF